MTKLKDIMWRIAVAHKIHEIYCEKTNAAHCAGKTYKLFGKYICSIDENTFLQIFENGGAGRVRTETMDRGRVEQHGSIELKVSEHAFRG